MKGEDTSPTDGDLSIDFFELVDVDEEDFEDFEEVLEDSVPVIEDYLYAINEELEGVNKTKFMENLGLQIIMDYSLETQPRS